MLAEGGVAGLVVAVERLGGFEEEAEVVGVIHARGCEMGVDFEGIPGLLGGLGRAASTRLDRVCGAVGS